VYVHRIGRTGRVGRSGRAITFVEPRQGRELAAIEKHVGVPITPWAEGAHTTPAPVSERPRRHSKPHLTRPGDEPSAKLIAGVGRADSVEVSDLVHAVTAAAGIDGEAISDVRVLEHFSLFAVPRSEAERIVAAVDGTPINGTALRVELARS
jgi:ATP-dependent RNA helicase DeaD